ncbi:hypothetical protein, conserved [Leishmania donovani]|uniref:REH2 DRSM domain-containing protein n=2 Tax=Leishmania donovani TaxID=5661 RepID=E9BKX4_LEIDO|nr:hypothetical protein, conserved [Leishmania donovani]
MPCDGMCTCATPMARAERAEVVFLSRCVCVCVRLGQLVALQLQSLMRMRLTRSLTLYSYVSFICFLLHLLAAPPLRFCMLPRMWSPLHAQSSPSTLHAPYRHLQIGAMVFLSLLCVLPLPFFSALCSLSVRLSHSGRLVCQPPPPPGATGRIRERQLVCLLSAMPLRLCAFVRGKKAHIIAPYAAPRGNSASPSPESRTPPLRKGSVMAYRSVAPSSQLRALARQAAVPHLPTVAHTVMRVQRRFRASFSSKHSPHADSTAAVCDEDSTDDWSSIEVEVLMPEPEVAASGNTTTTSTADDAATSGRSSFASPTSSSRAYTSVETIDAIDSYAKAKVGNFVRRCLQPSASGADDAAPSSSAVGLEVRQVQGCGKATQYHARWRLPLPAEFGERYGEGFAPTPKEAEAVAAMHAERVIDALGFQLFQLSSKQRKHAEAARAAGRWAPMPTATTTTTASSSGAPITTAEVVPPPDTPSPPPLQLLGLSAQQRQEKELRIDRVQFAPVQRGGFTPLALTLASPQYFDSSSHSRIERFFRVHRTSFRANLRLVLLKSGGHGTTKGDGVGEGVDARQHASTPGGLFLAQLILPLPARFGKRIAMGKAPTRKEAVLLACMHAELIIDAVGFALYPENREKQAAHAVECAKMRRWCPQPGDCAYRYTAPSPPPMELVEELYPSTVAAATVVTSEPDSAVVGALLHTGATNKTAHACGDGGSSGVSPSPRLLADAQAGSAPSPVESMLLQHQQAVLAVRYFIDEPSLRDFEPARLLLERYVKQFVSRFAAHAESTTCLSAASLTDSSLTELMLVEELGQRDRRVFRATITVPLLNPKSEQAAPTAAAALAAPAVAPAAAPAVDARSPLPYTQSFVAIGVSYTNHLAELAAAMHALRTLGALNRLCLVRVNTAVAQALESFAMRAQIPLHDAAQPMLHPSQLPPESLPAPVRVMEGFVGRIAASGLNLRDRNHLPKDMDSEKVRDRFATRVPLLSEEAGTAVNTLNREEDLLRELRARQERLPRMHWDTSPDADGRIIVSPDQDAKMSRMYNHTLSSVRQPDVRATIRLRDYLERHGKSPEMALSVVRVCGNQEHAEKRGLYVAKVLLPVTLRHQPKAKRRPPSTASSQTSALSSSASLSSESQQPRQSQLPEYVAQGEGPTRDDAVLLCAAHAEALLDAAGQPFYDHSLLQRKHADTARALGRWAPLVRGAALPPESLRRTPPPLRKVTCESGVWARLQEQRRASACEAVTSEPAGHATGVLSPASSTRSRHAGTTAPASASVVDDEALCDIAGLQFVYHTDITQSALRQVAEYFSKNGSDIYRMVRQYVVRHPELGVIHRAIVEMPLPASYGKRYAVGCASTKRHALFLCCSHALLILDALQLPVYTEYGRQRRYARAAAVKGRDAPLSGKACGKSDTPSPPGLYYLTTCAAAREKPPAIPKLPLLRDRKSLPLWGTFVNHCASYVTRRRETRVTEAVSSVGGPRVPRSNVVAEDATSDIAASTPSDKFARRQLADLCRLAGLPDPTDDVPSKSVALSSNERRFFTFKELTGTPYTMRGVSDASPAESRHRAFGQGIQLLLLVVRPNSDSAPTPRRSWWDGQQRTLCIHDCVRNQMTPHGCLWVLRMWAAMHYPPLCVRMMLRKVELPTEEGGKVVACAHDADVVTNPGLTPSLSAPGTPCPPTDYQGVASIVESRDGVEKVLYHAACETAGPAATTAADSVHRALRQLLSDVQRRPTMQTLYRFLSKQPQLHIPSIRVLADPEDVVHRLHALVCNSHGSERIVRSAEPLQVGHLAVLLTLLQHDQRPTASFYKTWPVELLLKWVGAVSSSTQGWATSKDDEADCGRAQRGCLPSTLESTFVSYGLARAAPSARSALPTRATSSRLPSPVVPTPLAGALALLCRCLPPLPDVLIGEEDGKNTAAVQVAANTTRLAERDRELPLQLAHLILMGLLLGCTPWAVRAAAIVACAEHTLEWYDKQQGLSAAAGNNDATAMTPPLPAPRLAPYVSVDVTEAVLASLDATAPPLPETVLRYASEVERRLEALWVEASASAAAGKAPPLPWLPPPEAWGTCLRKADASKQTPSPAAGVLTLTERRILRPLLQCAVATSAAPHAVWVRATRMEKGGGADEVCGDGAGWCWDETDAEEQRLVFQHRHAAHYAAVRVSNHDLTQVETLESANGISAMATCFAAFGCAVYPTEPLVASTVEQERASALFRLSRAEDDFEDEAQANDDDADDAADAAHDDEEGGEGEEDEKLDSLDDDVDVGQFARVFGTCVSPLAAALVASAPTRSASLQSHRSIYPTPDDVAAGGALRAVGENLPVLMTAFQETVPLLVHRRSSVPLLSSLSAHLRSRVETTTPFSPEERRAISQLFTMTVRTAADEESRGDEAA